jgi:glutamate synthase (NADPH/NADH) large chain
VGAHLSGVLEEHHEKEHVTTKTFIFAGTAGQSFGAFLRSGLTFRLEGDSNDYLGKGLSGGTIIVYPPEKSAVSPSEHVIAGNTLLYGATAGEAYLNGKCGERFAVRNSGAVAVCEGIGNHGCEYMTGGIVVILGPVGNNFGAGMTGGEAFILDREGNLGQRCHPMGLVMQEMTPSDPGSQRLRRLIKKHHKHTESPVANQLLQDWEKALPLFRHITPAQPDIS